MNTENLNTGKIQNLDVLSSLLVKWFPLEILTKKLFKAFILHKNICFILWNFQILSSVVLQKKLKEEKREQVNQSKANITVTSITGEM